ncbi:MAG TPA: lipid-binding SYLF domain-containing protein [Polyangia bacterium]|jgi:lipid-binding SYLF domain-containing protein
MKRIVIFGLGLLACGALLAPRVAAALDTNPPLQRVLTATAIVHDMAGTASAATVPPAVLAQARAVAIIPLLVRNGASGDRYGEGVLVEHRGAGWSPPVFVDLDGANLRTQVGADTTDLVLVFADQDSFGQVLGGQPGKLGATIPVAAGPIEPAQMPPGAQVLAYRHARGVFEGVALSGATLQIDGGAGATFYGRRVPAQQIFSGSGLKTPAAAEDLRAALQGYAAKR